MRNDQEHSSSGAQLLPSPQRLPHPLHTWAPQARAALLQAAVLLAALPVLLTLLVPAPVQGQVRFAPSVGVYAPLSDVGEVRDAEGATFLEAGRRSSTLALGAGVEVGPLRGLANLRGEAKWATSARVPVGGIGCTECELRSSALMASGALVFRPFMDLMVVQPYLVMGAGVARYDFDWRDMRNHGPDDYFRDQTRPTFQLGMGAQFHLGALRPRLEMNAHFSRLETRAEQRDFQGTDERQTSLFLTVGMPVGGR